MKENVKSSRGNWRKRKRWPITVSFNCSEEMYAWLKVAARGGSISLVVRKFLLEYWRDMEVPGNDYSVNSFYRDPDGNMRFAVLSHADMIDGCIPDFHSCSSLNSLLSTLSDDPSFAIGQIWVRIK